MKRVLFVAMFMFEIALILVFSSGDVETNYDDVDNMPPRFELISKDRVSYLNLRVFRDRETGREYLVVDDRTGVSVVVMPEQEELE